ncbi:MAG: hypothetical protein U0804_28770 [Gemmataceae bacterium]
MEPTTPLELRLAARRNRAARNRLLLLVALVLATGCAAAVGVTLALNRHRDVAAEPTTKGGGVQPPGKTPVVGPQAGNTGKPRSEWNHADLAAHLKTKGVEVRVSGAGFSTADILNSFLIDDETKQKVHVALTPSDLAASNLAASLGPRATAWNRFVLYPRDAQEDASLYRRVREALR